MRRRRSDRASWQVAGVSRTIYADRMDYLTNDLTNLLPMHEDERIIAVGWLSPDETFERGKVPQEFVSALFRLLLNPWQPAIAMGFHACPFCEFSGGPSSFQMMESNESVSMGSTNLYVPEDGRVFVFPSLGIHYIDAHQFRPPSEFQQAVLNCPKMRSMDYLKALRTNAPKSLFRIPRGNQGRN